MINACCDFAPLRGCQIKITLSEFTEFTGNQGVNSFPLKLTRKTYVPFWRKREKRKYERFKRSKFEERKKFYLPNFTQFTRENRGHDPFYSNETYDNLLGERRVKDAFFSDFISYLVS